MWGIIRTGEKIPHTLPRYIIFLVILTNKIYLIAFIILAVLRLVLHIHRDIIDLEIEGKTSKNKSYNVKEKEKSLCVTII